VTYLGSGRGVAVEGVDEEEDCLGGVKEFVIPQAERHS